MVDMQPNSAEATLADDLLDGADAAGKFLGIDARKVRRLVYAGHIPAIKKGRLLFFRKSELREAFSRERACT